MNNVKTKVEIDRNVRLRANLTFAGYEDIDGPVPRVGDTVAAWDRETNISAPAIVVECKPDIGLIYLAVAWRSFQDCDQLPAGPELFPGAWHSGLS